MSFPRSSIFCLGVIAAALFGGLRLSIAAIDAPVSPDASPVAHSLLRYLESVHGSYSLSGQRETVDWFGNDDNTEMNHILAVTGKLAVIRGYDYLFVSDPRKTMQRVVEQATALAATGAFLPSG